MVSYITSLDFSLLYAIQEHIRCAFLDVLMPFFSWLGNYGAVWILLGLVLCIWPKHRKKGVFVLCVLLLGLLIGNLLLKNLVARPRPCWLDESVALLIPRPGDYSFPSGHTLSSVSAATVLLFCHRRMGIAAAVLALLIAFSRLYLFVHFPSDVLFAMLLGVAQGSVVCLVGERLWQRLTLRFPKLAQ